MKTDREFDRTVSRMLNAGVTGAGISPGQHAPRRLRKTWTPGHWSEARRRRFIRDVDRHTLRVLCEMNRPYQGRLIMAEILAERGSRESREMLDALGDGPAHPETRLRRRRRAHRDDVSAKPLPKQLAFDFADERQHP